MNNDRHPILPFGASERTASHEAKRLLAEWASQDEAILRIAVCVAIAWIAMPELHEFFGGIEHTFTVLRPGLPGLAHYALAYISGGIL
ncbi:MAG: hypothetical protein WAK26_01255 [Terracidiphilus sp.]|jgi:hypothetical protein